MENQHRQIKGYRELSETEIAQMNSIKSLGPVLEKEINEALTVGADPRWAALAKTHFQQGLMALTRSIAKPDFF